MEFVTTIVKSSFSWKDLLQSTGSATKASISVLLVLLYGYLTRRYKWLSKETENVSPYSAVGAGSPYHIFVFPPIANIKALCDVLPSIAALQ
jgi:hypothetical protein